MGWAKDKFDGIVLAILYILLLLSPDFVSFLGDMILLLWSAYAYYWFILDLMLPKVPKTDGL